MPGKTAPEDLFRCEPSRIDLSLESAAIVDLVEDCWQLIQPLATAHRLAFDMDISRDSAVRADRFRLKQALLNLPGIDGHRVLEIFKADECLKTIDACLSSRLIAARSSNAAMKRPDKKAWPLDAAVILAVNYLSAISPRFIDTDRQGSSA